MRCDNVRDIVRALHSRENTASRIEVLSRLVIDLLVEVEALRDALLRLTLGGASGSVHKGYDAPCHDKSLTEGKGAYPAAYVDAAYVLHNAAGPSGGEEKLLARYYPESGDKLREALMLQRLGFTDDEIEGYAAAAWLAITFT
jgi:hypothetical protein